MNEKIAELAKSLGFHTLETCRSDHLDFREVAVWVVRDVLEAAYKAGHEAGCKAALDSARKAVEDIAIPTVQS